MPHKLIIGINPIASINTPEDFVPAVQKHLNQSIKTRSNTQKALQRHIKPLQLPRSFIIRDKIQLNAYNLNIRMPFKSHSLWKYEPYQVLKQISPVTYCLKLPSSLRIHNVFHVDLLVSYHKTEEHDANYPQPAFELIDGKEEYTVEEIIDKCINR